jgi:hypothetical protein
MGGLVSIWVIGLLISYFYFKNKRVDHPVLSAIFWPAVGVALLAGALTNPNSSIRGAIDGGGSRGGTGAVGVPPPPPPVDAPIERPKYGLIESGDE